MNNRIDVLMKLEALLNELVSQNCEPLGDTIKRVYKTQKEYAKAAGIKPPNVCKSVKRGDMVIDGYIYINSHREFKG